MTLYFAYGSNISRVVMTAQCPSAKPLGRAQLEGWRFFISADGYSSIARAQGRTVHGLLWHIPAAELAALDAYENVGSGLYRRCPVPVRYGGQRVQAQIYIGSSRVSGLAQPGYLDRIVLPAARHWKLPPAYVAELARWNSASHAGRR